VNHRRFFEQVLPQQLVLERFEDAGFDFVAANRQQVVAPTLIASAEAGESIAPSHDESRAADTALRQPGEQVQRTPRPSQEERSDRQFDREIRRAIAVNDRLRIATNCAPDCRVDSRPDPQSIVHDIGVRKRSHDLRHAAGT
jgi:hypothetical protein